MSKVDKRWQPGRTVVIQDVWQGKLWAARPVVVVDDREDLLALWLPKGTAWKVAQAPPERPRSESRGERIAECMIYRDWFHGDASWPVSTLWLLQPNKGYAVWVSWFDDGDFMGWYINIQEPFRRVEEAIQTMDLALDVVIDRNGKWKWKDEDELESLVALGAIDKLKSQDIRASGEAAIGAFRGNAIPFNEPWPDWKPSPDWKSPTLPGDWEVIDGG